MDKIKEAYQKHQYLCWRFERIYRWVIVSIIALGTGILATHAPTGLTAEGRIWSGFLCVVIGVILYTLGLYIYETVTYYKVVKPIKDQEDY